MMVDFCSGLERPEDGAKFMVGCWKMSPQSLPLYSRTTRLALNPMFGAVVASKHGNAINAMTLRLKTKVNRLAN